jgi:hypothetical protein
MAQQQQTTAMAQTAQLVHINVPADKAEYLKQISRLNVETLQILADKSKKPGIEQKLKMYKSLI